MHTLKQFARDHGEVGWLLALALIFLVGWQKVPVRVPVNPSTLKTESIGHLTVKGGHQSVQIPCGNSITYVTSDCPDVDYTQSQTAQATAFPCPPPPSRVSILVGMAWSGVPGIGGGVGYQIGALWGMNVYVAGMYFKTF